MAINWDDYDSLLGTMSDAKLAKKIGVSTNVVMQRRRSLAIPPAMLGKKLVAWDTHDHLLGTMSDAKASKQIGCSTNQVRTRRLELGIPGFRRKTVDWAEHEHLLGTMPDATVAKKIGCSASAISRRRKELGIPTVQPNHQQLRRTEEFWKKWDKFLGTVSDRELAAKAKISISTVTARRNKKGVTAYRNSKPKPRDFLFLATSDNWPWDENEIGGLKDMHRLSRTTSRNSFRAHVDITHLDAQLAELEDMNKSLERYHYGHLYGEPVYYLKYKKLFLVYARKDFWRR